MKRFIQCLAVTSLLAFSLTPSWADDTNLVQEITVQFLALKQGPTVTNRGIITTTTDTVMVDTRQVINALGTATGYNFLPTARLLLIRPLAGGAYSVEIRDEVSALDVTPFFSYELVAGQLHSALYTRATGRGLASDFSIQRLALVDGWTPLSLHFDVRGPTVSTSRSAPGVAPTYETTIDAAGAGDRSGKLLILQGLIRVRGNTLEVVSAPTTS